MPQSQDIIKLWTLTDNLPDDSEELHKVGRVTGFTTGYYTGLKTCAITAELVNGKERFFETWEHTITGSTTKTAFVSKGDSGSLLFDSHGLVFGILFGGSKKEDIGYFTSTSDLLEDIQMITGLCADDIRLVDSRQ